jgi:Matrixin/Putative peptidoglycan binding domain
MSKEQGFSRRAIYLSPLSTSADGVCALRCYLKHYGYLPQKHDTSKDTFDKDLEEGLKKFQGYYGLQTSGKLDGPTKGLLTRGRCGAPDATPGSSLEANIAIPWGTKTLTYHLGTPSTDLSERDCWAAVNRALTTWQNAGVGLKFTKVNEVAEANIAIHWGPAEDPDHSMVGNVLAHADFPPGESILSHPRDQLPLHFDDTEHVWVNGAEFNAFDIETVALHEIGHCLGLFHSNVRGAVMFAFVDDNFTLRRLQQDDILGIRQLYGQGWQEVDGAGTQTV